jgi:hypothetical protein
MKYAFIALALLFAGAAQAQQACPYAAPGQTSGPIHVSQTITIDAARYQIIDCSAFQFIATAPVNPIVLITSSAQIQQGLIRVGEVDGAGVGITGVQMSNLAITVVDIAGIQNIVGNGMILTGLVFDNTINVESIRDTGGNGLLAQTPGDSTVINVQGNHINIGQVLQNAGSGIAFFPGAVANTIIVGPVEYNAVYGCYDGASNAVAVNYKNVWIVNGANSNGLAAQANSNAAC